MPPAESEWVVSNPGIQSKTTPQQSFYLPVEYRYYEDFPMTNNSRIPIPYKEIATFCRKYHIRSLALFGSVLREDFSRGSDIDILIEFEKGKTPGFFTIFSMEEELSELFGGRKIDIRTPEDLSRYFRDDVISSCEVCYAT
ncbi:nucleotidyltransferase family protein [Methanocalculus chunghsingensis]